MMLAGNGAIKNYLEGVIPKGYFDFESVVENNKNEEKCKLLL